ncbi:hypothetical protein PsyrCH409_10245 [Pseudomonas viridiflava]|uniref:Uncharacterized protein n=1 Tax=Pseudomonas syringae pv. syringae TaxID=321 RepID=A0AAE5SAC7_PSESY|nr:hypothetical protein WX98_17695 [Pseudomonas syringae pv. persicae]KTC12456.1 hypothetical protein AO390_18400 [Pseudomonas marginalis ICMP 11289]PBP48885.1 hypothetical protein CCL10_24730 [Pseudomonas syringae]PCK92230.1 hypothetical protein PsyrCH409_10245 [Pseudomonas viridiflava]POD33392.1 hypothetical protein BKM14_00750 [Pseudomonas syringae pv. syringae]
MMRPLGLWRFGCISATWRAKAFEVITNSGIKLMVFKKPDALDGNLSSSEAAGGLKKGLASESLHFA